MQQMNELLFCNIAMFLYRVSVQVVGLLWKIEDKDNFQVGDVARPS